MDLRLDKSAIVTSKRFPLAVALGLLLAASIAVNLFLGWKVVTLRRAVARENREVQLEIGAAVPPIKATGMDGRTAQIKYVAGELPTVLYFFSPGCDTCERNVENIKKLAKLKRRDYNIVGLSLTEDDLKQYAKDHDLNFPVYAGLGVETTLSYKLGRVPQTTIVSSDGSVLANWYGPYDGKLRKTVESFFQIEY